MRHTSAVGNGVRPLSGGVTEYSAVGRPIEHTSVSSASVVGVGQVSAVGRVARRPRRQRYLRTRHRYTHAICAVFTCAIKKPTKKPNISGKIQKPPAELLLFATGP